MLCTPPILLRDPHRRRGSAILLVLFLLVILLLLGIGFVSQSRSANLSTNATILQQQADAATADVVDLIGGYIAEDYVNYLRAIGAEAGTAPGTAAEHYITYPGPLRPWLASLQGYDNDTSSNDTRMLWDIYPQISALGEDTDGDGTLDSGLPIVSLNDPLVNTLPRYRNVGSVGPPIAGFASVAEYTQWMENQEDTIGRTYLGPTAYFQHGSGVVSSPMNASFYRLPSPVSSDGTIWVAALRVIDTSGMVNLNTATQHRLAAGGGVAANATDGSHPSAVDLYALVTNSEKHGGLNRRTETQDLFQAADPFVDDRYAAGGTLNSEAARDNWWTGFGVGLPLLYNPTAAPGSAMPTLVPWATSDQARLSEGINAAAPSSLSTRLSYGTAIDPLYPEDPADSPPNVLPPELAPANFVTTYNATRLVQVGSPINAYRRMMPPWLDMMDGSGPENPGSTVSSVSGTNLIPSYRPALSEITAADLQPVLRELFRTQIAGTYQGVDRRYPGQMMAANIGAFRDTDNDPSNNTVVNSDDGNLTYYGFERQPFLGEAVTIVLWIDQDPDGSIDPAATAADAAGKRALVLIQLYNPFDIDLPLTDFEIQLGGEAPISLAGVTVPQNDFVILTSDLTGTNIDTYLTAAAPAGTKEIDAANIVEVPAGLTYTPPAAADANWSVDLLHNSVLVDRLRAPSTLPAATYWPAVDIVLDPSVFPTPGFLLTPPNDRLMTVASLHRDTRDNDFYGTGAAGSIPNYLYEARAANQVVSLPLPATPGTPPYHESDGTYVEGVDIIDYLDDGPQVAIDKPARLGDALSTPDTNAWPAPQMLLCPGRPVANVRELAAIFTATHEQNAATPLDSRPITEAMAERFSVVYDDATLAIPAGAGLTRPTASPTAANAEVWRNYAAILSTAGRLDLTQEQYYRRNGTGSLLFPVMAMPATLFDYFDFSDIVGNARFSTGVGGGDQGVVSGLVNVSTAPEPVLAALPYLQGFEHATGPPAVDGVPYALASYRDRISYVAPIRELREDWYDRFGDASSTYEYDVNGFFSTGEMLNVQGRLLAGNAASITRPQADILLSGYDFSDTAGPADLPTSTDPIGPLRSDTDAYQPPPFPDDGAVVADDVPDRIGLFAALPGATTVRSDTFLAYVKLVGLRPDGAGGYDRVLTRNLAILYDRTNVNAAGDRPRVLMVHQY
jgi:hypothetical protein